MATRRQLQTRLARAQETREQRRMALQETCALVAALERALQTIDGAPLMPRQPRAGRRADGQAWTRERILDAIMTWAREHHRPPLRADFDADRSLPHHVTVYRVFGSLATAREAAGLPAGMQGRGGAGRGGGWTRGNPRGGQGWQRRHQA